MDNKKGTAPVLDEDACNRLIDHYQSQQISSDRLQTILDETRSSRKSQIVSFALAASLMVFTLGVLMHQNILASQRTDIVMKEAALNHSKKLQMDAEANSLEELQVKLDELPFAIVLPESADFPTLAVVGGRYCTINGHLAAHVKLRDPETAKDYSLFLTPSADNLRSMKSNDAELSGVDVRLWHENDVVYAFAADTGDKK